MNNIKFSRIVFSLKSTRELFNNGIIGFYGAIISSLYKIYCNKLNVKCEQCNLKTCCNLKMLLGEQDKSIPLVLQGTQINPLFVVRNIKVFNLNTEVYSDVEIVFLEKAVNFITDFIVILERLGEVGFGKNKEKFTLIKVKNVKGQPILNEYGIINFKNIISEHINEYAEEKMKSFVTSDINLQFSFVKLQENSQFDFIKDFLDSMINRLNNINILEKEELNKINNEVKKLHIENINMRNKKFQYKLKEQSIKFINFYGDVSICVQSELLKMCFIICELCLINEAIFWGYNNYCIKGGERFD